MVGVLQGADAGAAEPEPGVASEDRPGLAVAQLQLHPPAGDDANALHHCAATTVTRAPPRSASVRTRD